MADFGETFCDKVLKRGRIHLSLIRQCETPKQNAINGLEPFLLRIGVGFASDTPVGNSGHAAKYGNRHKEQPAHSAITVPN